MSFGFIKTSYESINLSWSVIYRIYFYQYLTRILIKTDFISAFTTPFDIISAQPEGFVNKISNAILFTCGKNKVFWRIMLQGRPHSLNVVRSISPITQ